MAFGLPRKQQEELQMGSSGQFQCQPANIIVRIGCEFHIAVPIERKEPREKYPP
jgi:hypothetical protein